MKREERAAVRAVSRNPLWGELLAKWGGWILLGVACFFLTGVVTGIARIAVRLAGG